MSVQVTAGADRPMVVALHCSGSVGRQWSGLAERLGAACAFHAPDLFGTASRGHWPGARPFSLAEEAQPILELIDGTEAPVHLVGHSYGGGVALHLALARPDRIASLSLYEPSAFHLLKELGREGAAALAEIVELSQAVDQGVLTGAYRAAAARFVDFWGGAGAWAAMPFRLQAAIISYLPKACLDFRALIGEAGSLAELGRLRCPMLVLRGEHATRPTRLIAEALGELTSTSRIEIVPGAGHMGPVTHGGLVADILAAHWRHGGGAGGTVGDYGAQRASDWPAALAA